MFHYNLALQTLTPLALKLSNRKNMRSNQYEPIAKAMAEQGVTIATELIWGLPGDNLADFEKNLDRLAGVFTNINIFGFVLLARHRVLRARDEYKIETIPVAGYGKAKGEYVVGCHSYDRDEGTEGYFLITAHILLIRGHIMPLVVRMLALDGSVPVSALIRSVLRRLAHALRRRYARARPGRSHGDLRAPRRAVPGHAAQPGRHLRDDPRRARRLDGAALRHARPARACAQVLALDEAFCPRVGPSHQITRRFDFTADQVEYHLGRMELPPESAFAAATTAFDIHHPAHVGEVLKNPDGGSWMRGQIKQRHAESAGCGERLMRARQHRARGCALVAAAACSSSEHVVGDQCPSPYSSTAGYKATVRDRDGSKGYFGTSCAPCKADDQIKYDKRGCPIFVTFETCGGPVCLAGYEVESTGSERRRCGERFRCQGLRRRGGQRCAVALQSEHARGGSRSRWCCSRWLAVRAWLARKPLRPPSRSSAPPVAAARCAAARGAGGTRAALAWGAPARGACAPQHLRPKPLHPRRPSLQRRLPRLRPHLRRRRAPAAPTRPRPRRLRRPRRTRTPCGPDETGNQGGSWIGAGLAIGLLNMPKLGIGLEAVGEIRTPVMWPIEVGAVYWLDNDDELTSVQTDLIAHPLLAVPYPPGGSARSIQETMLSAALCPYEFQMATGSFLACGGASGGILRASGEGFVDEKTVVRPLFELDAYARWHFRLGGGVGISVQRGPVRAVLPRSLRLPQSLRRAITISSAWLRSAAQLDLALTYGF